MIDKHRHLFHIAVHEAGHTVGAWHFGHPFGVVTIVPTEGCLGSMGYCSPQLGWERWHGSRRNLANEEIVIRMAGTEAELEVFGSTTGGDSHDRDSVEWLMGRIRIRGCEYVGDEAWQRYELKMRRRTRRFVRENISKIKYLASALIERSSLDSSQVAEILSDWSNRSASSALRYIDGYIYSPFEKVPTTPV